MRSVGEIRDEETAPDSIGRPATLNPFGSWLPVGQRSGGAARGGHNVYVVALTLLYIRGHGPSHSCAARTVRTPQHNSVVQRRGLWPVLSSALPALPHLRRVGRARGTGGPRSAPLNPWPPIRATLLCPRICTETGTRPTRPLLPPTPLSLLPNPTRAASCRGSKTHRQQPIDQM